MSVLSSKVKDESTSVSGGIEYPDRIRVHAARQGLPLIPTAASNFDTLVRICIIDSGMSSLWAYVLIVLCFLLLYDCYVLPYCLPHHLQFHHIQRSLHSHQSLVHVLYLNHRYMKAPKGIWVRLWRREINGAFWELLFHIVHILWWDFLTSYVVCRLSFSISKVVLDIMRDNRVTTLERKEGGVWSS